METTSYQKVTVPPHVGNGVNGSTTLLEEDVTILSPDTEEVSNKRHPLDPCEIEMQPPPQNERKPWDKKIEFILSSIGYAVGLGNLWRFPYIAFKNGGGSFLIPYTLMIFLAGLPAYFLESALGQYAGQGPSRVYGRMAPALKGIGFSFVWAAFFLAMYYNVIVSWAIFYLFSGFQSPLPWANCANDTLHCHDGKITDAEKQMDSYVVSPPEDYFKNGMYGFDPAVHDWTNFGGLRWQMVLCLLGAWIIVCLCLIKGVQTSGKVVYFTGKPFLYIEYIP